uniref:Zinc finger E-box-binding homeobox 2 n=1 Tax=Magallana gigas TaxID=29159 RepID=K1REB3_MAGGI
MLSTAFLFHAEEEFIEMSLRDLNTVESVEEWAEKNGLNNHRIVVEKLEELRTERVEIRDEFAVQRRPVVRSSSLQCPDCPKSSKRKNELKVHIKARHENVSFSCSKCQKTFAYKTNAIRHEAKCNGDDQNSSFQQKSSLKPGFLSQLRVKV